MDMIELSNYNYQMIKLVIKQAGFLITTFQGSLEVKSHLNWQRSYFPFAKSFFGHTHFHPIGLFVG